MEVAEEKLLGVLHDQPAVVGMRCQRPLAIPVGDHPEKERRRPSKGRDRGSTSESRRRSRRRVVDADEKRARGELHEGRYCLAAATAVTAITTRKGLNGGSEIGLGEVRPQDVGEVELSVGRLPQQGSRSIAALRRCE